MIFYNIMSDIGFFVKMRYNKLVLDEIATHFYFDGFLGSYISKSEFLLKKVSTNFYLTNPVGVVAQ